MDGEAERLGKLEFFEGSTNTHRVTNQQGFERIIMCSGIYPIRMAISEDNGLSWSQLEPIDNYGNG